METIDDDNDDIADHLKENRVPGACVVTKDKPMNLAGFPMENPNPVIDEQLLPEDLIGRSALLPEAEDRSRARAKIISLVNEHIDEVRERPELAKFRCHVNGEYEEVIAYNQIVDYIEDDDSWDEALWKFEEILDHKKVRNGSPDYKGSSYNVLIRWQGGSTTWEPLHTSDGMGVGDPNNDPVTCDRRHDKGESTT